MVKKVFVFLLLFLCIAADSFAGGGGSKKCSCNNRYDVASADDQVRKVSRVCNQYNVGYRIFSVEGMVQYCSQNDVGDNGCDGECRHYVYSWPSTVGSCVGGKSPGDTSITWLVDPWGSTCWRPLCRTAKQYWQGQLKSGSVNYNTCSACRLRFIEIVDADPTEYSYIKVVPDPSNDSGCVAGSSVDNACIGLGLSTGRQADGGCVKKGCRCTSGSAKEYKGIDDDWYVKCG
jgi:hypothetical protein